MQGELQQRKEGEQQAQLWHLLYKSTSICSIFIGWVLQPAPSEVHLYLTFSVYHKDQTLLGVRFVSESPCFTFVVSTEEAGG